MEREFLDVVRARASRLYFVLTKVDYVSADEGEEFLGFLADEIAGRSGERTAILDTPQGNLTRTGP